jgi:predicted dehydrogenase
MSAGFVASSAKAQVQVAVELGTLRIAVLGCGRWGPNHVRNFGRVSGCRVAGVADTDADRLAQISEIFPNLRAEQDYRRLLDDPLIDAVVVATPTSTHHKVVREALIAGKHVLCEKPLCQTKEQAQELVSLARERQLFLTVGHVFLYNAGIEAIKRLVDSGELGKLYYLSSVRTNLGPIRNDVNAAYDLAAHDISIFNWILGSNPILVSATGGSFLRPGIEDAVFVTLKYPGNVIASIHASWLNPKKVRDLTVVGSRKMVTWDDLELTTPVAIYDRGANATQEANGYGEFLKVSMWSGDVRLPKVDLEEPLQAQAREFLGAIRGTCTHRSEGVFGLGVVSTLEAIAASLRMNGNPVSL